MCARRTRRIERRPGRDLHGQVPSRGSSVQQSSSGMRVREQLRQLGLTLHSQRWVREWGVRGRVQPDGRPLRSAARRRQPPEAVSVQWGSNYKQCCWNFFCQ